MGNAAEGLEQKVQGQPGVVGRLFLLAGRYSCAFVDPIFWIVPTMSSAERPKMMFPLWLLALDVLAMVGLALSGAELFPRKGGGLGWLPEGWAWPVFGLSVLVAVACMVGIVRVAVRQVRAQQAAQAAGAGRRPPEAG